MNVEPSVKWQQHSAAHAQPEPCCTDLSPSLHISTLSLNFSLMSSKWKASGSSPLWAKTRYFSEVGWNFCTGTPHCLMVLQRQRYVCGIWWGPLYSSMCVLLNLDFRNLAFWKCSAVGKWECTGSPWKDHICPGDASFQGGCIPSPLMLCCICSCSSILLPTPLPNAGLQHTLPLPTLVAVYPDISAFLCLVALTVLVTPWCS